MGTPDNFGNLRCDRGTASGTPSPTPSWPRTDRPPFRRHGQFTVCRSRPAAETIWFYGAGSGGQQGSIRDSRDTGRTNADRGPSHAHPRRHGNLSFGTEVGIIIVSATTSFRTGGRTAGIYARIVRVVAPFRSPTPPRPFPGAAVPSRNFRTGGASAATTWSLPATARADNGGFTRPPCRHRKSGRPFESPTPPRLFPAAAAPLRIFPTHRVSAATTRCLPAMAGADSEAFTRPPWHRRKSGRRFESPTPPRPFPAARAISCRGAEAGIIIVSGNTAVFGGSGSGGQRGIYGARLLTAALSASARQGAADSRGISVQPLLVGPPFKIADTPRHSRGTGNFTGFGAVSMSEATWLFSARVRTARPASTP